MEDRVKRPAIIWGTQVGLLLWSLMVMPNFAIASAEVWGRVFLPRQLIWGLLMGVLPLIAFWALVKKTVFARELTLISLICTWTYFIRVLMMVLDSRYDTFPASPISLSSFVLSVTPLCLLPVLFFKFGYGKKASLFFNSFAV